MAARCFECLQRHTQSDDLERDNLRPGDSDIIKTTRGHRGRAYFL
jgi:hypothetical protein